MANPHLIQHRLPAATPPGWLLADLCCLEFTGSRLRPRGYTRATAPYWMEERMSGRQERGKSSEAGSIWTRPTREELLVDGTLIDVTPAALSDGLRHSTAVTKAVRDAYLGDESPLAGDTPEERLRTLLHSLPVTHRNEWQEADEVNPLRRPARHGFRA